MWLIVSALLALPVLCMATGPTDTYQHAMLGHYYLMAEKPERALSHYHTSLRSSSSPYAYQGFIRFLFATTQMDKIVALMPKVDAFFAHDFGTQLIFSKALIEVERLQEAEKKLMDLHTSRPYDPEVVYLLSLLLGKKDPLKALEVIDGYLRSASSGQQQCIFYFLKSELYKQLNNKEEALKNVKKSLELCPKFDKSWLMFGMLSDAAGNATDALKGYRNFLKLAGSHEDIEQRVRQLLFQDPHKELAPFIALYDRGEFRRAQETVDHFLKTNPDHIQARILKVQTHVALGQIEEAVSHLERWFIAQRDGTWLYVLHLLYQAGVPASVVTASFERLEKKVGRHEYVALYLADMYARQHLFDRSLAYHTKAYGMTRDRRMKVKILVNMSALQYEMGRDVVAKQMLDQAQQFGIAYVPLYNALAYHHALQGEVGRAQQYVGHALALDKNNPHVLDTQAFIWHKQGLYKQAASLVERVAQQVPDDCWVQIHGAQISYAQGQVRVGDQFLTRAYKLARTEREKKACKHVSLQHKKK